MNQEKSITKRIVDVCLAHIRANNTKILWLTGLFLIVLPIHLFNFVFCWVLITLIMKGEDNYNTDNLYCSLPLRRSDIMISRFLLSVTIVLAAIIMGIIVLGISSVFSISGIYPGKLRLTQNIFIMLYPLILLFSFYFPLYFRYGYRPGLQMGCYTASLLAIIVWLGLLFVIASIASGSWQIGYPEGKNFSIIITITLIIKKGVHVLGSHLFHLFIGMSTVILVLTSFILSLKSYSLREF